MTTPHRPLDRAVATLLAVLLAGGCATVRDAGAYRAGAAENGGVEVMVFADDDARRALHPGPAHVVGVLERREGRRWTPVFRALQPAWAVADLPPGRYRLRFPEALDEEGRPVAVDGAVETFRVAPGEVRRFETTLEHVSPGWVAVGVVAAVVAAVVLHEWLDDHGVRPPPLPPGLLLDVAFLLTVDLGPRAVCCGPRPPVVTSHFPEDGAVTATRRLRVVFALSEPLGAPPRPDAVRVTGARTGPVPGHVTADPDRWWVLWEPDDDLPRDERFDVRLMPGAVADAAGNPLVEGVGFTFRTTP